MSVCVRGMWRCVSVSVGCVEGCVCGRGMSVGMWGCVLCVWVCASVWGKVCVWSVGGVCVYVLCVVCVVCVCCVGVFVYRVVEAG